MKRLLPAQATLGLALAFLALPVGANPDPAGVALDPVVVLAGQYPTGSEPGALLSAGDVALTPGANADINRALQALPGVAQVDEGNALFVRGGAAFETVTRIDGLFYPSPAELSTPAGTFAGTLNVFEARRIDFSSGALGARLGNALSGVVDLDTAGAPRSDQLSLGAGLGAASAGATLIFGDSGGARVTATRTDTAPVLRLNGSSLRYPEAPNGHNLGASAAEEYRPGAEIKLFAVEQANRFAVEDSEAQAQGLFAQSTVRRFAVASWKDVFGPWSAQASLGGGSVRQRLDGTARSFDSTLDHRQVAGRLAHDSGDRLEWSAGFDGAAQAWAFKRAAPGTAPAASAFGARDLRWGAYGELDAAPAPGWRAVLGARGDHSRLTGRATADPRLSLAREPAPGLTLFAAAGGYRQVPDAEYFLAPGGRRTLPPMRAEEASAGAQWSRRGRTLRVEAYAKRYADLVALSRQYLPAAFGRGTAAGLDLLFKSPLPGGWEGRASLSLARSRRTDPDTGRMADAPFDVGRTLVLVAERRWKAWTLGAAWRQAQGRPFTPVTGAAPDGLGGFAPVYGAPFSERLPSFARLDLSLTHEWRLGARCSLVGYASLDNALNRDNTYAYGYPPDYSSRFPVPTIFRRTLYFGSTLRFF